MILPSSLGIGVVSHDNHMMIMRSHSRTEDTDMVTSSTTLNTKVTDQMDNIIDIRCVTVTHCCVTTCVHVTQGV